MCCSSQSRRNLSRLFMVGAQLQDVQEAAGHRDPSTTELYDRRRLYANGHPPASARASRWPRWPEPRRLKNDPRTRSRHRARQRRVYVHALAAMQARLSPQRHAGESRALRAEGTAMRPHRRGSRRVRRFSEGLPGHPGILTRAAGKRRPADDGRHRPAPERCLGLAGKLLRQGGCWLGEMV
jgi:hypothetical protein